MKLKILFLFCTLSSTIMCQKINLRAGYAYGPETGLILFPPVKLSAEYCFSSQPRTYYAGITMGGNLMMECWGGIGIYGGYKINGFFFENQYNMFKILADSYYETPSVTVYSINPKIGFEKYHMYIKAGPYFKIGKGDDNVINANYLHYGSLRLNVEVGFHYDFDINTLSL